MPRIRASLVLVLLAFSARLSYAQTPPPEQTPITQQAPSSQQAPPPRWNPAAGRCDNAPQLNDPAADQCGGRCFALSAPRQSVGPTRPGESIELGLWDRSLAPGTGQALARVIAPDGTVTIMTRERYGPTWISVHYPTDFAGAASPRPGPYTVVWETRGLVICDGFTVQGS